MDILPALQRGSLVVVYAAHAARQEISHVAAQLALRGPLTVLDGGNRFQAYRIAQLLRKHTVQVQEASERLFIRRAFTCYQMRALLEDTPLIPQPYLILDLLFTFYDDQVSSREANRLLHACLNTIERLTRIAPVAITLGRPLHEERKSLIEVVFARATTILTEPVPSVDTQLSLF